MHISAVGVKVWFCPLPSLLGFSLTCKVVGWAVRTVWNLFRGETPGKVPFSVESVGSMVWWSGGKAGVSRWSHSARLVTLPECSNVEQMRKCYICCPRSQSMADPKSPTNTEPQYGLFNVRRVGWGESTCLIHPRAARMLWSPVIWKKKLNKVINTFSYNNKDLKNFFYLA